MEYIIRGVREADLEEVMQVEAICFPAAEAAGRESFKQRIETFSNSFFVAESQMGIIGFINGCVTDEMTICDEMFADTRLHKEEGGWQTIFGLDVLPEHRKQGIAASLMTHMIACAKERGKKGVTLTCKEKLLHYYETFGYENYGLSASEHGGAVWYDMILKF